MLNVTHERDLTFAGGGHLSAASGLVLTPEHFCVIADDDLHLGVFPRGGGEGTRRRSGRSKARPRSKASRARMGVRSGWSKISTTRRAPPACCAPRCRSPA